MTQHTPRKRFGQHFLHDQYVIKRIIDSLKINDQDIWVEIGPGQGALTNHLPTNINKLILIEIDRDLAKQLESKYAQNDNVVIINQDILKVDFDQLRESNKKLRIVGNLPYNISTPIFFHLAKYVDNISDMTFMVQKEVADRLTAGAGNKTYGRLTLSAGLRFSIRKLFNVSKGAFNPPPKVESSIIRLMPHANQTPQPLAEKFDLLVKSAFLKRRKTLKNSLESLVSLEDFEQASISPSLRAEALTINDFLKLAETNDIIRANKGF